MLDLTRDQGKQKTSLKVLSLHIFFICQFFVLSLKCDKMVVDA